MTAVFAANDEMAAGVIRALADHGIAVPGRISVVGYDDIPAAGYLFPRLTTVRQDFEAAATRGIELLLRRIEHPDERDATPDDGSAIELVLRDSTTPPQR